MYVFIHIDDDVFIHIVMMCYVYVFIHIVMMCIRIVCAICVVRICVCGSNERSVIHMREY